MAHSRPNRVENRGDAGRVLMASGTLTKLVLEDARVQAAYRAWRARHQFDVRVAMLHGQPSESAFEAAAIRVLEDARTSTPADATALRTVLAEMGLADRGWLVVNLLQCFQNAVYNQVNPKHPMDLEWRLTGVGHLPPGRRPPRDGADIARNVRWYYRHDIQQPPDTVGALADEYLKSYPGSRSSDAHGVIRNGIEQAKDLLDTMIVHPADE